MHQKEIFYGDLSPFRMLRGQADATTASDSEYNADVFKIVDTYILYASRPPIASPSLRNPYFYLSKKMLKGKLVELLPLPENPQIRLSHTDDYWGFMLSMYWLLTGIELFRKKEGSGQMFENLVREIEEYETGA
jgi:hypothetical protein